MKSTSLFNQPGPTAAFLSCLFLFVQGGSASGQDQGATSDQIPSRPVSLFQNGWTELSDSARIAEEQELGVLLAAESWPAPAGLRSISQRKLACYSEVWLIEAESLNSDLYMFLRTPTQRVLLTGKANSIHEFNKTQLPLLHPKGAREYAVLFCGSLAAADGYRFGLVNNVGHPALPTERNPKEPAWDFIPPHIEMQSDGGCLLEGILVYQGILAHTQMTIDPAGVVNIIDSRTLARSRLEAELFHDGAVHVFTSADVKIPGQDMRFRGSAVEDSERAMIERNLEARSLMSESKDLAFIYFLNQTESNLQNADAPNYDPKDSLIFEEMKRAVQTLIHAKKTVSTVILVESKDGKDRVEVYFHGQQRQIHTNPSTENGVLRQLLIKDAESIEFHWLKMAVAHGEKSAVVPLGLCYAKGKGTEKNVGLALGWYRQAAKAGDIGAMVLLWSTFRRHQLEELIAQKDYEIAELHDLTEGFREDIAVLKGEMSKADYHKSLEKSQSETDRPKPIINDLPIQEPEAREWLLKAAKLGNDYAQGVCTEKGWAWE